MISRMMARMRDVDGDAPKGHNRLNPGPPLRFSAEPDGDGQMSQPAGGVGTESLPWQVPQPSPLSAEDLPLEQQLLARGAGGAGEDPLQKYARLFARK